MKVTLDLTKLLDEGRISKDEHDRLLTLGAAATGTLAFNILLGFGVIAVSAGLAAIVQDATIGALIGLVLLGIGVGLYLAGRTQWEVFAHICTLIGALGLAAGVVILTNASVWAFAAIAVAFLVAGAVARSGLLVILAVLAFSSCIGARTDYEHASYFLGIEEPTLTIVAFSIVALGTYWLSTIVPGPYERLALQAARTSVLLVNLGFWVGSLWGDSSEQLKIAIPDTVYVIGWAIVLVAVGVWAAWANRRWVVNVVAVFGAIHFYTQWFERLGPNPLAVLLAGILALGFAIGLWYFNRALFDTGGPAKFVKPA